MELLVVAAIVGLLLALLLPAVASARAAARRAHCQNNLRQIGLGLLLHHGAHQNFPVGCFEWRADGDSPQRQLAWSAYLLPFLEESALFEQLDLSAAFDSRRNAAAARTLLPVYLCPTSLRGEQLVGDRGPIDYGGIFGERISSPNNPPKGVMLIDRAISLSQVTDGASHTLIVAEDSRFLDGEWINGRNIFDQAFRINAAPTWENDIRSEHVGGAQAARADGSVAFLTNDLALPVLAAICTRAGGELSQPQ